MDESHFRFLAEHSLDLICLADSDLVLTYASPSCKQLLGWNPEEMIGKGAGSFVHEDDLPVFAGAHEAVKKDGVGGSPTMLRMRKRAGDHAWMKINARLVPGFAGGENQVVLVMRDVTALMKGGATHRPKPFRYKPDHGIWDEKLAAERGIITEIDLYLTNSGHIAFLESARQDDEGRIVCSGYVLDQVRGAAGVRRLEWLTSGHCTTSGEDRDRIKRRI
ncbi:MAG: PAS domain-containing protein [Pusillimonas sp.]